MVPTIARWMLLLLALAMTGLVAAIAFYAIRPVDFPSALALTSAAVLIFPLYLLALSLIAAALALLARRWRVHLAAGLLALATAASILLSLWPPIAMWRFAALHGVPLSLRDYLANAAHINGGAPQSDRSVEYGTASDGTRLMLDVWPAGAGAATRPAIIIVHGGGWVAGARSMAQDWNRWFNGLGFHVFDIEYRLPPPERWKDAVGDVKCALGFVATNAARYGVDPTRISLKGDSAGAHLAMLAAYTADDREFTPSCDAPAVAVRSLVNLYGPVDLARGYDTSPSPDYARNVLTQFIGGSPRQFADRYRIVSPINHIGARTPPTITFLGLNDRIVTAEQAEMLDRALARAGVPHETYLLPATDHSFDLNWGGFATQFARSRIEAFLREQDRR